ncbi:unnamed protein product [Durusdinium trenchii]|uniref:Uncharacterized protein n=1 Tax=Durusdinium trenchii TaxID=1381693 RepID=A0ABP0K2A3_9DINO
MVDVLQATVQEILNEISRLEKGQAAGTEDYVQLLSDVERKAPLLGRRTVPLELLKHLDEGGSLESWCRDQAKRYVETLKEKQERGKPLKCLTRSLQQQGRDLNGLRLGLGFFVLPLLALVEPSAASAASAG